MLRIIEYFERVENFVLDKKVQKKINHTLYHSHKFLQNLYNLLRFDVMYYSNYESCKILHY